MTGLDLETFLRLLRADLWVWVSLTIVVAVLGLLAWVSWGSRRALRKCLVISVLVHLGAVAFGDWGLRAFGPAGREAISGQERIRTIRVVPEPLPDPAVPGVEGPSAVAPRMPWDEPGRLPLTEPSIADRARPAPEALPPLERAPLGPLVIEPATPTLDAPEAAPLEARAIDPAMPTIDAPDLASNAPDLVDLPEVAPAPGPARAPAPDLTASLRATGPRPSTLRAPAPFRRPAPPPLEIARAMPSTAPVMGPDAAPAPRALPDVPEVYRPRLEANRSERAQRVGASAASEEAVERALAWLARHQDADGRWDAATARDAMGNPVGKDDDFTTHCPPGDLCHGECHYWEADPALTGLALLAYLGAGHTHQDGQRYENTVRKGLNYLITIQKPDGDLRDRSRPIGMYCHAMATLALCEAYALTRDERLWAPARRAVQFLMRARARDGMAWRYAPGDPMGDTSILGWVVLALKSAREIGIDVPPDIIDGAQRWLKRVARGANGGLAVYQPGTKPTPTMTAEAWVCRRFLGEDVPEPATAEAVAYLLEHAPSQAPLNLYYWYYGTLALYQRGGSDWEAWNAQVRDELVRRQLRDGHQTGSWGPADCTDRYDALGGRVYCTALATLTLEVYYRYQRLEAVPGPLAPTTDASVRRSNAASP